MGNDGIIINENLNKKTCWENDSQARFFIAQPSDEGRRADSALAEAFPELTRSAVQRLLALDKVILLETSAICETDVLRGKALNKNYRLRSGDRIAFSVPPREPPAARPEAIALDIVYEDADILIINKPRGMVTHPAPGHSGGTLANALLYYCGHSLSGENGPLRPGIVHRLDKDTSGLIAAAKHDQAHQRLAAQLADHSMRRVYHAIVFNNIKEDRFTIDQPIGRHPADRKKMTVMTPDSPQKSRNAVTHITVLERFGVFTWVEARLETGRTHQIRVHLKHNGHPLLGDTVYGTEKQPFNVQGQILHAKCLRLIHPGTGKTMEFETDLPPYFTEVLGKIRGRTQSVN